MTKPFDLADELRTRLPDGVHPGKQRMTDPTPLYEALDALWDDYISVNGGSVGFMTYLATRLEAARRDEWNRGGAFTERDYHTGDAPIELHVDNPAPFIAALLEDR